ncbi:MAG: ABC-type sugar transport system permease subunit [bacterium]|jgi:ABC-type sugar transport system permease subunit/ABC-type glycerol-3-phosphate transport system substrate-binding protein
MRKAIQVLILFIVASFIVCVSSVFATTQPTTLKVWQFWPEKWLEPAIKQFEKQHPNVKVKVERLTWSDGFNKIITSMAANQAPDVIELGSTWVAGLSAGGGLKNIQVSPSLKKSLVNWEPATVFGKIYAVPWTVSTTAVFYNKELLKKAGIQTPPKTWNELLIASKKIHALDKSIYGYGLKTGSYTTWQKFLPFAWSNGGRIIQKDLKTSGMNSPAFIESIQFYKKLQAVGLYDDNLAIRKAFKDGKIGFMMEGPGQIKVFKKESPDLKFGVIPLPVAPTGKSIAFMGGQMLAITKNTTNQKMAEKLIQFLTQPETTKYITSQITTLFPAHKNAIHDDFYQKEHPELLVFLKTIQTATAPFTHPKWIYIQEIFSEQLDRVMYNKSNIKDAVQEGKRRIEKILNTNNKRKGTASKSSSPMLISLLIFTGIFIIGYWSYGKYQQKKQKLPPEAIQQARKYNVATFLFLAPWLFVFFTFSLYPIGYSFYLSFTQYIASEASPPIWIGIDNYVQLVSDENFLNSIKNSFVFVFGSVPITMVIAVILAVTLNRNMKFRTFYRVSYFMPVVTSLFVIATLFLEMYSPTGVFNGLLGAIGIEGKHWLKDPEWALTSIIIMNVWASFGFYTLMLLAGLQSIPIEYYEASSIEGAGKIRQFFTITLPLLKPTLLVATMINTILAFQIFGEIFIMTKGGPLKTTETAVYYLYDVAFHKQRMGYGSAAAYIVFLILAGFSFLQFRVLRTKNATK